MESFKGGLPIKSLHKVGKSWKKVRHDKNIYIKAENIIVMTILNNSNNKNIHFFNQTNKQCKADRMFVCSYYIETS